MKQAIFTKSYWLTSDKIPIWLIATVATTYLVLRFVGLELSPPGFYLDESAGATNILCLVKFGKDGNGVSWPLFSEGLNTGLYTPTYLYSGVVWTSLFGSSVTAFRGMTAFYSAVTIVFLYGIALHLTDRRGAILTAAVAAISPWAFQFARIAWDPALVPCFLVAGIYFYLTAMSWKGAAAAGAFFAAAMYSYPPARVQVPLVVIALTALPQLSKMNRKQILPLLMAVLCLTTAPLVVKTLSGQLNNRFELLNALSGSHLHKQGIALIVAAAMELARNFSLHLGIDFLFFKGDTNLRHSTGAFGILSWLDVLGVAIFIVFVVFYVVRAAKIENLIHRRNFFAATAFCLAGFLSGILPAAMTWESLPHALRSFGASPFVALFTGLVLYRGCLHFKWLWSVVALVAVSFAITYGLYFFENYPAKSEIWFTSDLKRAAEEAGPHVEEVMNKRFAKSEELARRYYSIHYNGRPCL